MKSKTKIGKKKGKNFDKEYKFRQVVRNKD